jgi:hypothetical protein
MFQKKHYEALAKLIKESDGNQSLDGWVATMLNPMLIRDNPLFDRERFLKACYNEEE